MPKAVDPLNNDVSPTTLPDRTNLSKLYGKPLSALEAEDNKNEGFQSNSAKKQDFQQTFLVNLIVSTCFVISYLSISAIYALRGGENGLSASDQVLTIVFSAATVFTWLLCFMGLRKVLARNETVNLSTLLTFYSFFIFPATKIVVDFHQYNIYMYTIVSVAYTLASLTYLLMLSNALAKYEQVNKQKVFKHLILFIISIMLIAILTTYLPS